MPKKTKEDLEKVKNIKKKDSTISLWAEFLRIKDVLDLNFDDGGKKLGITAQKMKDMTNQRIIIKESTLIKMRKILDDKILELT